MQVRLPRTLKISAAICGFLAIVLWAIFLILLTKQIVFLQSASRSTGKVVEIVSLQSSDSGTIYAPVVEYQTPDGQTRQFQSKTSSSLQRFSVGEAVPIVMSTDGSQEVIIYRFLDLWLAQLILFIVSVIFSTLTLFYILPGRIRKRRKRWLDQHGMKIEAEVQQPIGRGALQVNNQAPYIIIAQWKNPETSQVHVFKSSYIWYDPSQYIQKTIPVLIDPKNPKRYIIDVSQLPDVVG